MVQVLLVKKLGSDKFIIDNSKKELLEKTDKRFPVEKYSTSLIDHDREMEEDGEYLFPEYEDQRFENPHMTESEFRDLLKIYKIKETEKIQEAMEIARESHKNQKRKSGKDYLEEHIYPVTADLITYFDLNGQTIDENSICAALLHDSLEDNPNLSEDELKKRIGRKITGLVVSLTKQDHIQYEGKDETEKKANRDKEYHSQLQNADLEARLVKLADRHNNIQSMQALGDHPKKEAYLKETEDFYLALAKETNPDYHTRLHSLLKSKKAQFGLI